METKLLSKKVFMAGMSVLSSLPMGTSRLNLDDKMQLEMFYQSIADMDDETFQRAVILKLRYKEAGKPQWFPTPGELLEFAGFINNTDNGIVETSEAQWQVFSSAFGHIGYQVMSQKWADGESIFEDATTEAVAKTIAKEYALSNVSESGNWRSRFIKAYDNTKEFGKKTNEVMKIGNLISLSQHKQSELDTKIPSQTCKK